MGARIESLKRIGAGCVAILALAATVKAQPPMGSYPPAPYGAGAPVPGYGPMPGFGPGLPGPMGAPMGPVDGPTPGLPCPPGDAAPSGPAVPPYNNSFAPFNDYAVDYCNAITPISYLAVDFLEMRTHFDRKDEAFTSTVRVPGVGGPGEVDFADNAWTVAPRITVQVFPFDEWGVSASWYRYAPGTETFSFQNSDPNATVTSARLPIGHQISSPQNYFFASQIPGFPFPNSVAAGSPDNIVVSDKFSMQVADLEFLRFTRLGSACGTLGFGVRYAYISHSYLWSRVNNPNLNFGLGNFDPFDDDADLTFIGNVDYDQVFFGYNYTGVGPKLSMNVTWPINSPLQVFGKVAGSFLMGQRREKFFESFHQRGELSEDDFDTVFENASVTQNSSYSFLFMPVADLELGISLQLMNLRVHPTLKVSGIAQYWPTAGNATNPDANLFLYGVSATAAIEF